MNTSIRDFVAPEALARAKGENGLSSRLPTVAYRDGDFLALERRRWLRRTWLFVGRGQALPHPGDVAPVPGHPYFLMRNGDGDIRVFHNVCRHRGHRLVDAPCNKRDTLVCPYHGWTYDLDGRLIATPHFGGHRISTPAGFDPAEHGLVAVRSAQWHDWIFVNADGGAEPFEAFIAPIAARFPEVDFAALDHFLTIDLGAVPANWKICLENTMEPYHVPVAHRETAAGQPLDLHTMVDDGPVVGCAVDIEGSGYTNQPSDNTLDNLDMSARYLLRVPNFFITSYAPDKMIDTLILPDSRDPSICWIQSAWYSTSGRPLGNAEVERWRALEQRVADEDISIMSEVQRGVESEAADDGGVLSPAYETCITGFYRHLIAALGG